MTQVNETTTATNQAATHAPAVESTGSKHRLIEPTEGHRIFWKLKTVINTLDYISQELRLLRKQRGIVLNSNQSGGLDSELHDLMVELESIQAGLMDIEKKRVCRKVVDHVNHAINQYCFLLNALNSHENGKCREFYSGEVEGLLTSIAGISDSLRKAYSHVEKFAKYDFNIDTNLYRDGYTVTGSLCDVISKLDDMTTKFTGKEEGRLKVLTKRKKATKEVRRLCLSAWTLMNVFPASDKVAENLTTANNNLHLVYQNFLSDKLLIDIDDLGALGRLLSDAKNHYQIALNHLLQQDRDNEKHGGIH